MTNEELFIKFTEAVRVAIAEHEMKPTSYCNICRFDADTHRSDHEAVKRVIEFFDNLNEAKWSVVRKTAWLAAFGILSVAAWGLRNFFMSGR